MNKESRGRKEGNEGCIQGKKKKRRQQEELSMILTKGNQGHRKRRIKQ